MESSLGQQYALSVPDWSLGLEKAGEMARNEMANPFTQHRIRSLFMSKRRKAKLRSVYWSASLRVFEQTSSNFGKSRENPRLPLLLSHHAICMTAQLWVSCFSWAKISYTMALKNVASRDSKFIAVCAAGDLETARQIA